VSFPQPTRRDHDTFCRTEGWREVRNARGGTVRHHVTYEFDLATGEVLRTRISRPVSGDVYGPALWRHILRDQLQVDEATFWACARDGVRPDRGAAGEPAAAALPADLVHLLIHRVGVTDTEVAAMTRGQAIERLNRYWTEGHA
jgi:hypothetical protein